MRTILFWAISWIISALLLIPCFMLSFIDGFKVDYHNKFHVFWDKEVLSKL